MKEGFPIRASLGALVLATALPLIALSAYNTYARFLRETDRAGAEALRGAQAAATEAEDVLQRAQLLLIALAKRPNLRSLDAARCAPIFGAFSELYPEYTNLLTIHRDGTRLCSAVPPAAGAPAKVDPALYLAETLRTGKFTVGQVTRGLFTGRWITVVAQPISGKNGEINGIVAVSIDLASLRLIPRPDELPQGARARIVDARGTIIASSEAPENPIGQNIADTPWLRLIDPERTTIGRSLDSAREDRIFGIAPIKGTTWHAAIGIPTEVVFAPVWNRTIINTAYSLTALLLAIALAYLIARRITRPIESIATDVRQAAQLHTASVPEPALAELPTAPREIQMLAGDFHSMLEARNAAEKRIARLMRIQGVLSGINSAIVRIRERQKLFDEACRIAVQAGEFPYVWLGLLDRDTMAVVPVAWQSLHGEALVPPLARRSVVPDADGRIGIVGQAVRDRKPCISNDVENDPRIVLHREHRERGIRSLAILPLMVSDEAVGALAIHAAEVGFFDQEEMNLLQELAGDIGFALDHMEKAERLNYLAYYDELTGLANGNLFQVRLEQHVLSARTENRNMALLLIDIERFKTINDTLGRHAGDQLLKQIAARMSHYTVDANRLARLSADHFAVAIPELASVDVVARRLEQKFREWFGEPYLVGGIELRIAAKVGIAIFPEDGGEADVLFRNAEAALKRAKSTGEHYLFYTQQMTERIAGMLALENKLRRAVEKEEFVLHYQPKVDLASGGICGAEALIRWNDPQVGLVPPGDFIPLLEETGLILEAGRWALRQAIEDHLRWRAAGFAPLRIAVNVSPLQLRRRDFIEEVQAVLSVHPQAAAGLELEITESLIMEDVNRNFTALEAIRAMGVIIAIDDFGTGYSSLSYLAKLPVDTLKIDRFFVNDMTTGPQGVALVSTIINLAHSLELKVVAEGVETEEQARLLRLLNCDQMQGYLFSMPVPAQEFAARFLAPSLAA